MNTKIVFSRSNQDEIREITSILEEHHGDRTLIDPNSFILAKMDSKIIGCVRLKTYEKDNIIELASLVVLPEYRKQGVGSKLVELLLKNNSQRPIYLLCNKDKEKFYKINGFNLMNIQDLPPIMYKDYLRVIAKMPDIKENVIAMNIGQLDKN